MPQSDSDKLTYLQVKQLSFKRDKNCLVDNLNFNLVNQQKVALVGLNGAGKSSLLKLLVGEYPSKAGSIEYCGMSPNDLKFKDKLGYQPSEMSALDNFSCREYLNLCCVLKTSLKANPSKLIDQVIQQWKLDEIIDRPMHQLSQGNMQKLAIAQAFLGKPECIILDEPTQALDPIEQQRFINNLANLTNVQLCLFSSHHISETVQAADSVLLMHHGHLIAHLSLNNQSEYWLASKLSIDEMKALIKTQNQQLTINLSYQGKVNLFKINGLNETAWQQKVKLIVKSDPNTVALGSAQKTLMPLFALLANESL